MKVILPKQVSRFLLGAFCFVSATCPTILAQTPGAGGVLIKKPYAGATNKSGFQAQEYAQLQVVAGNVLSVKLLDEEIPKRMSTAVVADYIDYPASALFETMTAEPDAARLRTAREQLQQMQEKWPKTQQYVQPFITRIDEMLEKFGQGQIMVSGQWVDKGTMKSFTLESGISVEAMSITVSGFELAAETELGIRRYTFFDLSDQARQEYFPEFAEKVKAADAGDKAMMEEVAMTAYNASLGDKRFEFARKYFEQLAVEGDEPSRYRLGLMKQNGIGMDRYLPMANTHFKLGAQKDFPPAGISYGYALYYGFEGGADQAAAYEQFQKMAADGNQDGRYLQALMLAHGVGVEEADDDQAVQLLLEASEAENAWAMYDLALALDRGIGIERDDDRAKELIKLAASLGNPIAENALGYQLLTQDMQGNATLAVQLFKSSANAGYPGAMFNLGVLSHHGFGVPLDFNAAEAYYRAAEQAGIEEAENQLRRLSSDRSRNATVEKLRGRVGIRTFYTESQPSWREDSEAPLEFRLSLFRKSLEQPWLPGGDATEVLASYAQPKVQAEPEAEPASEEAAPPAEEPAEENSAAVTP